ncbi:DUF4184 family protein [Kitasatospora camelliae]|uniref:DUF4184 family protein n=1 Tax=Kitasatospora camelliae TaxID=3156397 RepID=A0AAU8JSG1_9ACTN
MAGGVGWDGGMPFTLSHVAVVGVLGRGRVVGVGLVAGAMAPDVPYFADSVLPGVYRWGGVTHRWWGVGTVDVAVAGVMAAGWCGLLRGPVTGLLPEPAAGGGRAEPGRPGWFAVSAALGAASHVGWDAFTHRGRAGVRAFPVLARPVGGVPLYTVLQYGTSLLGLAVLARRAVDRYDLAAAPSGVSRAGRRAVVAGLAAAAAAGAVHRLRRRNAGRGRVDEACFGAGAGLVLGAAAYALGEAVRGGRAGAQRK